MSCKVMETFHWLPLLLLLSLVLWHGSYCGEQLKINETTKDGAYLQYAIVGITSCSEKCITVVPCESYDYHPNSLTCLLYTSDVGMYRKAVGGMCSKVACNKTSVCLRNHYGKVKCVPDIYLCGDVPIVPHAKKKSSKGYYRGAVSTYNCKPTYTSCVKQITSSCESNGQWKPVPVCAKFIWHRTITGGPFLIPCEPVRKFTISFQAKPTKKTQFQATLLRGNKYILLSLEFRLRRGNVISLNAMMNGKWNGESKLYHSMKPGKQMSIVIQLRRGYYKLTVDGASKRYRSANRKILPQLFGFGGDVSVPVVKIVPGKRR